MELKDIIEKRRAYRCLKPVPISDHIVNYLIWAAQLSPSCFNNQPWRYVFVRSGKKLEEMKTALSKGNEWAYEASMMIAVCSTKDDDCVVDGRDYFLFDTGLGTAFLVLAATDIGLVAHPIAGFSGSKVKNILKIPDEMQVISLVIVGDHHQEGIPLLTPKKREKELERPERKAFSEFVFFEEYKKE